MAGSARTAYDEEVEPLLEDVSEEGGEGVLIGRFVTSQRAGRCGPAALLVMSASARRFSARR
jgi:hypothetical protein